MLFQFIIALVFSMISLAGLQDGLQALKIGQSVVRHRASGQV